MESIVRAAMAGNAAGSFRRMPSDGPASEGDTEPQEPPPSPSPAVRFASPVAIPFADKDELRMPPAATAAGGGQDDEEAPAPPATVRSETGQDFMAVTVSSLIGQRLRAASSQSADLNAMALIGFSAFIYSL